MQIINADIVQSINHAEDKCTLYVELEKDDESSESRIYKDFDVDLFDKWEYTNFSPEFFKKEIDKKYKFTLDD